MKTKPKKRRYSLVEYCDMCPHLDVDDIDESKLKYLCGKSNNREIPEKDYKEGIIPNWCPLPKED